MVLLQKSTDLHGPNNLAVILHGFGQVTRLVTNVQKGSVVRISCLNIKLWDVLEGFPTVHI